MESMAREVSREEDPDFHDNTCLPVFKTDVSLNLLLLSESRGRLGSIPHPTPKVPPSGFCFSIRGLHGQRALGLGVVQRQP